MGTFTVVVEIGSADRDEFRSVEALVDTGATFSWIPGNVLRELGHDPLSSEQFETADGRIVDREIAEVPIRLDGKLRTTPCVFGDEGARPILGAVTMEQFLLAPDPIHKKLVPVTGLATMAHGKNYRAAMERIEEGRLYEPREAVKLLKETAYAKFDETVELHVRTGLDTRHADQQLRGTLVLPHGLGKEQRVIVFAEGEGARLALENGADEVGSDDLIKKIEGGWLEFELALAVRDMMGKVGRLGRVLGPRGLMPNPRTNTVVEVDDLAKAIGDAKQGRVEFRTDRTALVHVPIGKVSFSEDALLDNLGALVDAIQRERPAGAKGQFIRTATLAATMGPPVRLDVQPTLALTAKSDV
jgi:large subunit ribosomal protein L1